MGNNGEKVAAGFAGVTLIFGLAVMICASPFVAIFLCCGGAVGLSEAFPSKPRPVYPYGDGRDPLTQSEARSMAERFAATRLTYPDNSEFHLLKSRVEKQEDGTWLCSGAVDAVNAFGLKIPHVYTVTMRHDVKSRTWDAISVEVRQGLPPRRY